MDPCFPEVFFLEKVYLGFWYFLLLNPVIKAQGSGTTSKSCCNHIVITSLLTRRLKKKTIESLTAVIPAIC